MKKKLLSAPTFESFVIALRAWRLLLIAGLIGALIGAAVYQLWPPPYRAMARVVVDQNLEQALPEAPDREVFYFLERETQKLEDLAWSDEVMAQVMAKVEFTNITQLRDGKLQLSQPGDGGWRMYGIDPLQANARALAVAWSDSFTDSVHNAVMAALELEAVKNEMAGLQDNTSEETQKKRLRLEEKATELEDLSRGIHPAVQVSRSQKKDIAAERVSSMGAYILAAALSALFLTILFQTFSEKLSGSTIED